MWRAVWALLLALGIQFQSRAQEPGPAESTLRNRAIPLTSKQRLAVGLNQTNSAGLFVGISDFSTESNLQKLNFAVDDAVALAHVFTVELQLLNPKHVALLLGGKPRSAESQRQLDVLKQAGALENVPTRDGIINALGELAGRAQFKDALVVLGFSTHGYESQSGVYLMPVGGDRDRVPVTGVPFDAVKEVLEGCAARSKLLILDACLERPKAELWGYDRSRGRPGSVLKSLKSTGVFSSCRTDERSWEAESLGQGVFTHFLLNGLRGDAKAGGPEQTIRITDLATHASKSTRDWVKKHRGQDQVPWYDGKGLQDLPLANLNHP